VLLTSALPHRESLIDWLVDYRSSSSASQVLLTVLTHRASLVHWLITGPVLVPAECSWQLCCVIDTQIISDWLSSNTGARVLLTALTHRAIGDWLTTGAPPVPAKCSSQLPLHKDRVPLVDWLIDWLQVQYLCQPSAPHSCAASFTHRALLKNTRRKLMPGPSTQTYHTRPTLHPAALPGTILALLFTLQLHQVPYSPWSSLRYHAHSPTPHTAALPGTIITPTPHPTALPGTILTLQLFQVPYSPYSSPCSSPRYHTQRPLAKTLSELFVLPLFESLYIRVFPDLYWCGALLQFRILVLQRVQCPASRLYPVYKVWAGGVSSHPNEIGPEGEEACLSPTA
jgi:hypothetical protein